MPPRPLARLDQIDILLEEYRALHSLALYRIGSLERRVPVAGAVFTGLLGVASLTPGVLQLSLLVALPIVAVLFVATTLNHVKSFEDLLRRIEVIERSVNGLAGADLMAFQSNHPSRRRHIGGRIGMGSAASVATASLLLIGLCASLYYASEPTHGIGGPLPILYGAFLIAATLSSLILTLRIKRYRSAPSNNPT